MTQSVQQGGTFKHRVFFKPGDGDRLHIYIEGDGQAWWNRHRVSRDPTPHNPIMLKLMMLDPAPAIYIARPCYYMNGIEPDFEDSACTPYWWTFGRYSRPVVDSLATIVKRESKPYKAIVLIGHSGGGTIATLLAEGHPKTEAVVTLAANLKVSEWVSFHHYTPLVDSLDPTLDIRLSEKITQLHYIGANDTEVKADWFSVYLANHPNASLTRVPDVTHQDGWEHYWPAILSDLAAY